MRIASRTALLALSALAFLCSACIRLPPHVAREFEPAATTESDNFRVAPVGRARAKQQQAQ